MKRQAKKNNSFEKLSPDDDDEKVDAEPTKKPMRKIKKKIRIFQNKFNIDDETMLKIIEWIIKWDKIKKKNKEKKQEKEKEKREEERQKKNKSTIKNLKHTNHILREEIKGLKKNVEHLEEELRRREEEELRRREEEEQRRREEEEQRRREEEENKKSNFPKDINDFENNPTKQQWYALSKKYHPDKGGSKQFMQKINDIWAEHKIRYDSN
jgi:septal ring factor EnvC (AmiA/AmiB activator)